MMTTHLSGEVVKENNIYVFGVIKLTDVLNREYILLPLQEYFSSFYEIKKLGKYALR